MQESGFSAQMYVSPKWTFLVSPDRPPGPTGPNFLKFVRQNGGEGSLQIVAIAVVGTEAKPLTLAPNPQPRTPKPVPQNPNPYPEHNPNPNPLRYAGVWAALVDTYSEGNPGTFHWNYNR